MTVTEELSFARNTRIIITVETEIIADFFLKPEDEFLQLASQEAATAVFKYFKNLERQSQEIIRY